MITDLSSLSLASRKGFLVIEGLNGAGKTTIIRRLLAYLRKSEKEVIETFEPGATALGKSIRSLVLESKEGVSTISELFLFAADRAENVHKIILPALRRGALVISDRYYYSTFAFQGFGRGIDLDIVNQVNNFAVSGLYPDLVILLDIDPSEGLRRTVKRKESTGEFNPDAFEKVEMAFHQRLREGFLTIARECREPFLIVDARRALDKVYGEVEAAINTWIGPREET